MLSSAARIAEEVIGFVLSGSCAGCDAPGVPLCERCREALGFRPVRRCLRTGTPVLAALEFDSTAARVIRSLKEEGRTALARPLGELLGLALRAVDPDATIVPIPTSRAAFRRRGFRVPELLVRRAGLRPARLLLPARPAADQRELSLHERERNVRGTMRLALRAGRPGRVVLVDDVTTTGATLEEAERMLSAAGFAVQAAVALASTPRRAERGIRSQQMQG